MRDKILVKHLYRALRDATKRGDLDAVETYSRAIQRLGSVGIRNEEA